MEEIEEKKWCVYCHTNKINGKKYIGITGRKPEIRWGKNGQYYKNNRHFDGAIQKYGWSNFTHEILYSQLTKYQACELEIKLIALYNTTNQDIGYNFTKGGNGSNGILNGTNSKKVNQYTLDGVFVATYDSISEAIRQTNLMTYGSSISECCRGKREAAGNFQWKYTSDITEIKSIEDAKHRASNKAKLKILQYGLDGNFIREWDSAHDAYIGTDISAPSITGCCLGRYESAGGYQWRKKVDDLYSLTINSISTLSVRQTETNCKKILQIDMYSNQIISEFDSIKDIIQQLKFNNGILINCCKHRRESYKGYIWRYAEEYYSNQEYHNEY